MKVVYKRKDGNTRKKRRKKQNFATLTINKNKIKKRHCQRALLAPGMTLIEDLFD